MNPRFAMTLKTKIFGVFALSLLMAWGALAILGAGLVGQNVRLENDVEQTTAVADGHLPLVIRILDIKTNVIQVQQWLTDISATRAAPGLDDGFAEAAGYAERFALDVAEARKLSNDLGLAKVLVALNEIEAAFPAFYAGGREMAQTYIDRGPEGGNLQMEAFDAVAAVMSTATDTLVKTVETEASATLAALSARASAASDSNKGLILQICFLALAAVVVTGGGLAYLFRDLSRCFRGLDADIAAVMAGDAAASMHLDVDRRDEFGPVARALTAFRASLAASHVQATAIRAAAEQEETLRREAEQLRLAQAKGEADRVATEKAETEAIRTRERATAKEIAGVVAACAEGDFSHRLRTDDKDGVFAELCEGVNRIGEAANQGLGAVRDALDHLADGDLTYRMPEDFYGVFAEIAQGMNRTANNLSKTLTDLSVSSGAVDTSAHGISDATDDLAKQAEKNAAMLEQTTISLEQMLVAVKSSAGSAETARSAIEDISAKATAGNEVVNRAVAAMDQIQSSSDGITKILEVMSEISFQTNLLALNAGVEAARAGEAGRGFAVVASEVRALAQRSSEAADEIAELINASGSNIKNGVGLVHDSGRALQNIVTGVADVAGKITAIVIASNETAAGIGEISNITKAIDRTTKQNAAVFAETKNAVMSLRTEATTLAKAVGVFRFDPWARTVDQATTPRRRA
jgi:methyl-accepting chemotaxis protein